MECILLECLELISFNAAVKGASTQLLCLLLAPLLSHERCASLSHLDRTVPKYSNKIVRKMHDLENSGSQLEKAVGEDVRVASKEGSIEYYRASVVGGNAAAVDVVYEDLPGVRESIDRSSRRLWHGTLNNDGWEVPLRPDAPVCVQST